MALPTNVNYGTVTGRFLLAYQDSSDGDLYPDGVPAKGSVIFTPSPVKLLNPSALPAPVTILPAAVEATINSDGYLEGYAGSPGIRLVATDDADLNPLNWTWRVDFRLTDDENLAVNIPAFSFSLPSNTTVDLADVSPVPDANGVYYIVGEDGAGYDDITSDSSHTIGTGSKTFTINRRGALAVGNRLRIASSASPTNFMEGVATSVSGSSLTVNVTLTGGSGTFSAWNVLLTGEQGTQGPAGALTNLGATAPLSYNTGTNTLSILSGTTSGNVLSWNGSAWVNTAPTLDFLSNVTAPSPTTGQVIYWDGSAWVNVSPTLDFLSNVTVPSPTTGQVLYWNGTAWVNTAPTLDFLSNVVAPTPTTGDIIVYNGTEWVNQAPEVPEAPLPAIMMMMGA